MFTGDDILDAWTPDGRPAGKQPRRIIGALGLSTTPPMSMPPTALPDDIIAPSTGPSMPAAPMAGGMAPQPVSPAPMPDAGATAPPPIAPTSPVGAGDSPRPKPQPEPQAKPKPVTNADLSAMGTAGGYNAQVAANEDVAKATRATADQEADAEIAKANALAERNDAVNAAILKRQQDAEAQLKAVNDKSVALNAARDKWASTKIDRSVDHPIMAAISVALGAIGSAMAGNKNGENPALDMLFKSIDRKVAGQMQDLDKAGKALDMRKEQISEMRTHASDKLAMHNLAISAESEKAARRIEEIVTRSNSAIVKAKGAELAAQIRAKSADALATAIDRQSGVEFRDKQFAQQQLEAKQANAARWAGIAQADRHFNANRQDERYRFDEQMKFNREKSLADEQAAHRAAVTKMGEEGAKQFAANQKENEERGLHNPATGKKFLTPEGEKLIAQAEKLEAQAKAELSGNSFNPMAHARAKMLEEKASQIRGDAENRFVARASSKVAPEVNEILAMTQHTINEIDDIKRMAKGDVKSFVGTSNGEKAIRTKAQLLVLGLKEAYQTGTLDDGSVQFLNKTTGGDPTKINVNTFTEWLGNSDSPDGALDALADSMTRRAQLRLKSAGHQGVWKPQRFEEPAKTEEDKATEAILENKTSSDRLEDNEAGFVRTAVENAVPVLGNVLQAKRLDEDASASADFSTKYPGLPSKSEAHVDLLVRGAQQGSAKAQAELVSLATNQQYPASIRSATLRAIKENTPSLYQNALDKLPAEERKIQEDIRNFSLRKATVR